MMEIYRKISRINEKRNFQLPSITGVIYMSIEMWELPQVFVVPKSLH